MKISMDDIHYLNALANISGVNAKDCIVSDNVVSYLVKGSEIGKAIGKDALNVKTLSGRMKKKIEILEYSNDVNLFLAKALYNVELKKTETIDFDGKKILNATVDAEAKSKILSNTSRLRRVKELAKRNYGIDDIRIR